MVVVVVMVPLPCGFADVCACVRQLMLSVGGVVILMMADEEEEEEEDGGFGAKQWGPALLR